MDTLKLVMDIFAVSTSYNPDKLRSGTQYDTITLPAKKVIDVFLEEYTKQLTDRIKELEAELAKKPKYTPKKAETNE